MPPLVIDDFVVTRGDALVGVDGLEPPTPALQGLVGRFADLGLPTKPPASNGRGCSPLSVNTHLCLSSDGLATDRDVDNSVRLAEGDCVVCLLRGPSAARQAFTISVSARLQFCQGGNRPETSKIHLAC